MNDDKPLKFIAHSRTTVLGASLLLESLLPELTTEQINKASTKLALAFAEQRESICQEILDEAKQKNL